ncbi:MAG: hypothetical protein RIB60_10615 [Phycisphaerales bacterium]
MTEFEAAQEFDPNAEHLFAEPPKWPKVVGILSITFGSIAIFCGAIGMAMLPLQASFVEGALNGDPPPPTMVAGPIDFAIGGYGVLTNILLIVAGVMCVSYKPATRAAHLLYAPLSILGSIAGTWYNWSKQAKVEQWLQDYPDSDMAQALAQQQASAGVVNLVVLVVFVVLFMSWPTFCLVWFGISKTKPSDITGESAPAEDTP